MKRWLLVALMLCALPMLAAAEMDYAAYLPESAETVDLWVTPERVFLLADDAQAVRRLSILTKNNAGYDVLTSGPVTSTARLDVSHSSPADLLLKLVPDGDYCYLSPAPDGSTWYVSFIGAGDWFELGYNYVLDERNGMDRRIYGTHPWSDLRTADLTAIPQTLEEALALLDGSGWAVIDSGVEDETVALLKEPKDGSDCLGEYFTGTPVRPVGTEGPWTKVEIAGVQGWVDAEKLILGEAMSDVKPEFPNIARLSPTEEASENGFPVYDRPHADANMLKRGYGDWYSMDIIGKVGEEWFHVVFRYSGTQGYVRQDCFRDGNG